MIAAPGERAPRRIPLGVVLVWLALAGFLLARSASQIAERRFPDPDDILRLVQVRDLLAGQGWFDLHQYRVDSPAGIPMHWSRIVDAPLALLIAALTPLLGQYLAEQVTLVAMPLVTLAAILLAVAKAASYHLRRGDVTLACLCAGLSSFLLIQVQPLRIDHHGWQIFAVMLALVGVAQGKHVRGAILAGFALAAGLSISLEMLPIAAGFGAVYALRWLGEGKAPQSLVVFLAALAVALAALFLATRGIADLTEHCDAISPVHLGFFAIAAAGVAIVARAGSRSPAIVLGLLAVTGAAALGFFLWSAPECATGPFGNLDPLVREFWYSNIMEGLPVWKVPLDSWLPVTAQGAIAIAVLAHRWSKTSGDEQRWWLEYLLVAGTAFVSGLLTWRSMAFVGALSAIPLGWLVARLLEALREAPHARRKFAIAGMLVLALVPAFPLMIGHAVSGVTNKEPAAATLGAASSCDLINSAPKLDRLKPAVIFAPFDIGPLLLLGSHHEVVATGHHRAERNMHDVIAAFLGSAELAHRLVAKHKAGYVLICTDVGEVALYEQKSPKGFAAMLIQGHAPDWLEPVELNVPSALKIWRVVPAGR